MEPELKDWLNSINFNKDDLTEDDENFVDNYCSPEDLQAAIHY